MDGETLNRIKSILRDGSLSKEEKLERIKNILKDMKYNGRDEFGRGKGIFRVEDIHSDSVGGVMAELRIEGSADGRVIIELKTSENPEIFMPEQHYKIVEERWHWPYTGTGFISSRNGEILPEYYLSRGFKDMKNFNIEGIKITTADGKVYTLNW